VQVLQDPKPVTPTITHITPTIKISTPEPNDI
jgi:hypothetical protein